VTTLTRRRLSLIFFSCALFWLAVPARTQGTAPLVQQSNLAFLGSFKLPNTPLGSTYGLSYAGTNGIGTYAVAFNRVNNSLFIGGNPQEQKVAEFAIPASLSGTPTAAVLQNLRDPLEGRLSSINPTDPNQKVIGTALVMGGRLIIGAFSFYDGAGTQTRSYFARPVNLSTVGQVVGPVQVGNQYPGWVDRSSTAIPMEWQSAFGGPALAGGGGGSINSLQSWGPSATVFDPARITGTQALPGTSVLGYPYGSPLADTAHANQLWQQTDRVNGMVFIAGSRSVLFFGYHGLGDYCYGTGGTSGECYDPDDIYKGTHAYPYRSQVWAYDANDLLAVKNGSIQSHTVRPYAVWELDTAVKEIQGVGYDPDTQTLYLSQARGDGTQPIIRVYRITGLAAPKLPQKPTGLTVRVTGN
jgi:hypothetical protein